MKSVLAGITWRYIPLVQLTIEAAEDLKGQFPGAESIEDTFGFLCSHFVWETVPLISGRNFVISFMQNRLMHIRSISKQIDIQQLPMLFKLIEDFSTLHLCTRVLVPFYEEFKSLFMEIGYDRYTNSIIMDKVDNLPINNGFSKILLPEINYFKTS